MTVALESARSVYDWAERIVVALYDHQPWFQRPLTHRELQLLTNLDTLEVSRGCWQGRLQRLLYFHRHQDSEGYTLTPLGLALARRLKGGHKPVYSGEGGRAAASSAEPEAPPAAALAIASIKWRSGTAPTSS
jgi:hypothetical protein